MKMKEFINVQYFRLNQKMSWPIRQKSSLDLLLDHRINDQSLKIQQLVTFPFIQNYKPKIRKLIQKNNALESKQQKDIYLQLKLKVDNMYQKYYSTSMIQLKNQLSFLEQKQCLKRYYYQKQYQGKIQCLGEYYKYHEDLPRIFIDDVDEIIASYQQEKRDLEYRKVRQKIEEQKQTKRQIEADCKKSIFLKDKVKNKKPQKLLKNIHLSYVDFQKKPPKLQKRQKSVKSKNKIFNNQKNKLSKSNSLSYKNILTKDIDLLKTKIHKHNQNKNNSGKHSQEKKLTSKYSYIMSQLLKKKRSSSKSNIVQPFKNQNNKVNVQQKRQIKENQIYSSKNCCKSANKNQIQLKQHNFIGQQQLNLQLNGIQKKMVRSKSHAQMNVCKSSKLLKTIRDENNHQKELKNLQQNKIEQDSVQKQQKVYNSNKPLKTMRKCTSTKSVIKSNQHKIAQKIQRIVKVFQITKKDLALIDNSKQKLNKNIQNYQTKQKQKCQIIKKRKSIVQKLKEKQLFQINKNWNSNQKQNILGGAAYDNKKRCTLTKTDTNFVALTDIKRKKQAQNLKQKKQPIISSMFDRVLKTKMR